MIRIKWLKSVVVHRDGITLGKGVTTDVPETDYFKNAIALGYAEIIPTPPQKPPDHDVKHRNNGQPSLD